MKPYTTIAGDARVELTFKRSRFIGSCKRVQDEPHAREVIEGIRKEFWDAAHNCFAFVTGENSETARSSDDGEPSGTAGQPILDVILGNKVTGALIVVTRYFGGVLLGRGGLVQAYSKTAAQALKAVRTVLYQRAVAVSSELSYPMLSRAEAFLKSQTHELLETVYAEKVTIELMIPAHTKELFLAGMTDATDGGAVIRFNEETFHAFEADAPA